MYGVMGDFNYSRPIKINVYLSISYFFFNPLSLISRNSWIKMKPDFFLKLFSAALQSKPWIKAPSFALQKNMMHAPPYHMGEYVGEKKSSKIFF